MILTHILVVAGLPPAGIAAQAAVLPLASTAALLAAGAPQTATQPALRVRTRPPVLPVRQP